MSVVSVQTLDHQLGEVEFDIYIERYLGLNDLIAEEENFKEYLASLAVDGYMYPENFLLLRKELHNSLSASSAMPVRVKVARSHRVLLQFAQACQAIETDDGPSVNGHAPTLFAASRIAHVFGRNLSSVLSGGGLKLEALRDIVLSQNGRGADRNDASRRYEARLNMAKMGKQVTSSSRDQLRNALTKAEFDRFEADLAALRADIAEGKMAEASLDDALFVISPSAD